MHIKTNEWQDRDGRIVAESLANHKRREQHQTQDEVKANLECSVYRSTNGYC